MKKRFKIIKEGYADKYGDVMELITSGKVKLNVTTIK